MRRTPIRLELGSIAALVLVLLLSAAVATIFHNRFWAPADEGNYAHVAERLLSGETLHRDVQDVHAGYIDFVNAAAFSIFGLRLVSLRYPLAVLTVLQSGLVFLLLRGRGVIAAGVGSLTLTALTFVQFLNPTANWYCLFLVICTIAWLCWVPHGRRGRYVGAGFLVGTTFFFRQLSGVILGIGVLAFLLMEWPDSSREERGFLPQVTLAGLAVGILGYLLRTTDALGWLLFGLWPFPILFHIWRRTTVPDRALATMLLALALGAAISGLPLLAYQMAHGSVRPLLADSYGAAVALPGLNFIERPGYLIMGLLAWHGLQAGGTAERLNGVLWLGLLSVTAILGMILLRALIRANDRSSIHPLPIVAVFYALVSLHYQLPIYLFYTVGLSIVAVLWLTTRARKASGTIVLGAAIIFAGIAMYYQAAMPLSRGVKGIVAGERRFPRSPLPFSVAGLYVDSLDAARYTSLIGFIQRETLPGDTIFTLPSNAELYFLSRRTNQFKFYNTALGIRSTADQGSILRSLECDPPKLVFYSSHDKYNTPFSIQIAESLRATYDAVGDMPPFQVFRRSSRRSANPAGDHRCGVADSGPQPHPQEDGSARRGSGQSGTGP